MQLLEPERHPNLYKCMYGLLMLLPQSSAFAALKNRLNSVSAIGYLHIGNRGQQPSTPSTVSTFERQNRLKNRDEGGIKWTELLERFRQTQEKVRRTQQRQLMKSHGLEEQAASPQQSHKSVTHAAQDRPRPGSAQEILARAGSAQGHNKGKGSLSNLGRFTGAGKAGRAKK
jgi:vacuole morphology and inheritance protein 14